MGFYLNLRYDTIVQRVVFNQTCRRNKLELAELWTASRAVLFDFDGVLADSEPFYRKSWNTVLAHYGHSVPEAEYWKHWAFYGEGLAGEMQRTGLLVSDTEAAHSRQQIIYREYCINGDIPLFPLAFDILRMVMAIKPCAIASNTDSAVVKTVLGDLPSFPAIIGGEGLRSKPFPDIFLKASSLLGIEPAACLVFEDAWKGVKAAAAAGMPSVIIRNRYNSDLSAPEASCELNGLGELFLFLRSL